MQKYINNVTNATGDAVAGASVTVYTLAGTLATIYSTSSLVVSQNPLTTNSLGGFSFYAADGRYTLVISGTGITTQTISDIILEDPADELTALASSSGASLIGFTQPGGTLRTVQDKLRDVVSVKDFGAVGNGVADDSAAINAAFAFAYGNNGNAQKTVYFPSGVYRVTQTISAMVSFLGEGPYENNIGSRIRWEGSSGQVLNFPDEYKTGWTFQNLEIDMSSVTTDCVGMYFARGVNNATFRNIRLKGYHSGSSWGGAYANHDGIYVVGGSGGTPYNMSNCVFDHVFFLRCRNGITVTDPAAGGSGTNCLFTDCFSWCNGWSVKMAGANNTFISFESNAESGNHTYWLNSGLAYSWVFINCDYGTGNYTSGNEPIYADTSGAVSFATILGGTLEQSNGSGNTPNIVLDVGATGGKVIRYLAYGVNNFDSDTLKVDQLDIGQNSARSNQNFYKEGTWTPTFSGLAVVLGGGSVTYSGKYTLIGNIVHWSVKIQPAGGATTESTGGTTYLSNLPLTQTGIGCTCTASNAGSIASYGVGQGGLNTKFMYTPTWPAVANGIIISGSYFTDGT